MSKQSAALEASGKGTKRNSISSGLMAQGRVSGRGNRKREGGKKGKKEEKERKRKQNDESKKMRRKEEYKGQVKPRFAAWKRGCSPGYISKLPGFPQSSIYQGIIANWQEHRNPAAPIRLGSRYLLVIPPCCIRSRFPQPQSDLRALADAKRPSTAAINASDKCQSAQNYRSRASMDAKYVAERAEDEART
ncbi:hypothetical protein M441DRAFT_89636 [Trichoderma asperellum CBS 433.97]|uniref:Uncharacterized protein n=1 Tax=Trichoderma asperellum (strain ATCC 204424 / CBS 433.97 / NBRC 101777) TaxID=1042311 RepID=A0A2T3Z6S1_TRIA4|nr:hypothetical protein M441DRAFT_89636 [Trichoderma asperellum CBS 433.97]PTB40513.1 hypothetical protein M441DRAFT_89636 [Trichoderma asperellum CBS 433.97]